MHNVKNLWLPVFGLMAAALLVGASVPAGAADLTVQVDPNPLRLTHGATAHLVADVFSADGRPTAALLTWEVLPSHLGAVSPDGTFTAQGIGRGLVRVTARSGDDIGVGHAMITVTPVREALAAVVTIDPPQVRIEAGGRAAFRARATDPTTGETLENVTFQWRAVPPELGLIDANGVFQAGPNPGSGHVVVQVEGQDVRGMGQSRVVIGPAAPANLEVRIAPKRAFLTTGGTRAFEAVVTHDGKPVDPAPRVEWSVIPAELGTITSDGVLHAGDQVTDGRVVATIASAASVSRGYGSVAVRRAPQRDLAVQIQPREAVIIPGGQQRFEVAALGPEGELTDAQVTWEVQPPELADVTADGVLTVRESAFSSPGSNVLDGEVIARVQAGGAVAVDRARFLVRMPPPDLWLRVLPARVHVAPGEQVSFSAELVGRDAPADARFSWSVTSEMGTISPDGLFTASETASNALTPDFGGRDGVVQVTAVLRDGRRLENTAVVIVRPVTADTRVSLHPAEVNDLHPGDGASFRMVVNGRDAQSLGVKVRWLVDPPTIGAITDNGEFRASEMDLGAPVTGRIVAEVVLGADAVYRATSIVRVSPSTEPAVERVQVIVSPSRILLTPSKGQLLTITVMRPDGSLIAQDELIYGVNVSVQVSPADLGYIIEQRNDVRFVAGDAQPPPDRPFTGQVIVSVSGVTLEGQAYEGRTSAAVTISRRLSSDLQGVE